MNIEFANRLCAYRKAAGLSQEALAAKIGVSRQAVSKWERAETSPDTDNLIQLARLYGVTLDALLNLQPQTEVKMDVETAEQTAEPSEETHRRARRLRAIPYPVLCSIAYLVFGFTGWCGGWAWGWQVFLSIPLFYTGIEAIEQQDPYLFCYPVLAAWVYFWLGIKFDVWHPAWLVFLTIPVYYGITEAVRK